MNNKTACAQLQNKWLWTRWAHSIHARGGGNIQKQIRGFLLHSFCRECHEQEGRTFRTALSHCLLVTLRNYSHGGKEKGGQEKFTRQRCRGAPRHIECRHTAGSPAASCSRRPPWVWPPGTLFPARAACSRRPATWKLHIKFALETTSCMLGKYSSTSSSIVV